MINPSANAFLFGDFTIHHKDWLSYSDRTDRPGELCYDLTHMLNFPARNLDCDSDTLSPLDLFLSSDDGIVLQWLSLHLEILIMSLSQFPLTLRQTHILMPCFIV